MTRSFLPLALGETRFIRPDVAQLRLPVVNVFLLGEPGSPWVLVDAGTPLDAERILRAAAQHHDLPPEAIILTHGHLDHIGALRALLKAWPGVPVYAHPLEWPHLTGQVAYPFPDPTVGGSMSLLSPLLSPGPFQFADRLRPLPDDGTVPAAPGWQWRHTPGHSNGHVSLWRETDRTLIAGDAVVTTRQEDLRRAVTMHPSELRGPPRYYTSNWQAARASAAALAALNPQYLLTGHGFALESPGAELAALVAAFGERGQPPRGWYLGHPVPVEVLRPGRPDPLRTRVLTTLAALLGLWWWQRAGKR
ncbi:MBL fold metallo-hydrolase [Deinococcus cavernae]|uniref:MBL fold metallo-hydrolase n=1 Tax=Deinococcus cavernae TaxID=2320857 RepID=A0A418VGK8_9DEIO|nr:MBL fold metallo-hydrolase [Deinococcus cavernae]RJF75234.1 MBL fold metallo-hydrolase [Deinococcus cavernae]